MCVTGKLGGLPVAAMAGRMHAYEGHPVWRVVHPVRTLARLGADATGMSTVAEAIAARHLGLELAGISCITNRAAGIGGAPLDHAEVQAVGREAATAIGRLAAGLFERLAGGAA